MRDLLGIYHPGYERPAGYVTPVGMRGTCWVCNTRGYERSMLGIYHPGIWEEHAGYIPPGYMGGIPAGYVPPGYVGGIPAGYVPAGYMLGIYHPGYTSYLPTPGIPCIPPSVCATWLHPCTRLGAK